LKVFQVIGKVTLSRCHPSFQGAKLLAAEPEGLSTLGGSTPESPDLLVVWDDRGAGAGDRIAVSDGAEAAQAFRPELKPVDAYSSAILDEVYIDVEAVKQLKLK
jgi:ethanolamine utilization protein EutN